MLAGCGAVESQEVDMDIFIKKANFWMFCDILYMCYNIIQNWMGTILNPAIDMFVKLKYQTWIIL